MKIFSPFVMIGLTGLLLSVLIYCKKETSKVLPTLTASVVTNITATSATAGGEVIADGGATVTARGVCWSSINITPTTADSYSSDGSGLGKYLSSVTGLSPGTTYNIRAFATNSVGTAYYSQTAFKTIALAPVLITTDFSDVTSTSFKSGGNITGDGGLPIISRGVCWGTDQNPSIAGTKTTDGIGSGIFISSIIGLIPGATYYFKAYASNSIGNTYGNLISVKTLAALPTLTTATVSLLNLTTATSGGNITSDGGATVTARGVCWSINQNPTISESKTTNGTGSGSYSSVINGLNPGTTYYVRAYASNIIGTSYGNQVTAKTASILPTLTTTSISINTSWTASSGGNITSDGGVEITARGVCWSIYPSPIISNNITSDGIGTGNFTSLLTALTAGTTYYVRAYATTTSGTAYGNEILFSIPMPPIQFNTSKSYGSLTDVDGNVYKTILIGSQLWMAENLKTIKFNDGSAIPLETGGNAWFDLSTPGYCWHSNAAYNKDTHGALYNWYTVNTKKLCPTGWHVPTDAEWTILTTYLGGTSVAGGKLKETGTIHWESTNASATNTTGFTAVPGGLRGTYGKFDYLYYVGFWWSSSEYSTISAYYRRIEKDFNYVYAGSGNKASGFSVRCIKD